MPEIKVAGGTSISPEMGGYDKEKSEGDLTEVDKKVDATMKSVVTEIERKENVGISELPPKQKCVPKKQLTPVQTQESAIVENALKGVQESTTSPKVNVSKQDIIPKFMGLDEKEAYLRFMKMTNRVNKIGFQLRSPSTTKPSIDLSTDREVKQEESQLPVNSEQLFPSETGRETGLTKPVLESVPSSQEDRSTTEVWQSIAELNTNLSVAELDTLGTLIQNHRGELKALAAKDPNGSIYIRKEEIAQFLPEAKIKELPRTIEVHKNGDVFIHLKHKGKASKTRGNFKVLSRTVRVPEKGEASIIANLSLKYSVQAIADISKEMDVLLEHQGDPNFPQLHYVKTYQRKGLKSDGSKVHKIGMLMEYFPEGDFANRMASNLQSWTTKEKIVEIIKILKPLRALHRDDIHHGDVHDGNFLVDGDRTVVIDFSLSGKGSYGSMKHFSICGPEQLQESKPKNDPRLGDAYGVGIIMWKLLTKKQPLPDSAYSTICRWLQANSTIEENGGLDVLPENDRKLLQQKPPPPSKEESAYGESDAYGTDAYGQSAVNGESSENDLISEAELLLLARRAADDFTAFKEEADRFHSIAAKYGPPKGGVKEIEKNTVRILRAIKENYSDYQQRYIDETNKTGVDLELLVIAKNLMTPDPEKRMPVSDDLINKLVVLAEKAEKAEKDFLRAEQIASAWFMSVMNRVAEAMKNPEVCVFLWQIAYEKGDYKLLAELDKQIAEDSELYKQITEKQFLIAGELANASSVPVKERVAKAVKNPKVCHFLQQIARENDDRELLAELNKQLAKKMAEKLANASSGTVKERVAEAVKNLEVYHFLKQIASKNGDRELLAELNKQLAKKMAEKLANASSGTVKERVAEAVKNVKNQEVFDFLQQKVRENGDYTLLAELSKQFVGLNYPTFRKMNKLVANVVLDKIYLEGRKFLEGAFHAWTAPYLANALNLLSLRQDLEEIVEPELLSKIEEMVGDIASELQQGVYLDKSYTSLKMIERGKLAAELISDIKNLEPGKSLLVPLSTKSHSVLARIKRDNEGTFSLIFYNTGDGLYNERWHATLKSTSKILFQTFVPAHKIPPKNIMNEQIWTELLGPEIQNINEVYDRIDKLCEGGQRESPKKNPLFYEMDQETGSCAFQCQLAMVRERFLNLDPKNAKVGYGAYKLVKNGVMRAYKKITEEQLRPTEGQLRPDVAQAFQQKLTVMGLEMKLAQELSDKKKRIQIYSELRTLCDPGALEDDHTIEGRTTVEVYSDIHQLVSNLSRRGSYLTGDSTIRALVNARIKRKSGDWNTQLQREIKKNLQKAQQLQNMEH